MAKKKKKSSAGNNGKTVNLNGNTNGKKGKVAEQSVLQKNGSSNGEPPADANPPKTTAKTQNAGWSFQGLLGCFCVALWSFGAGVLTPPLLSFQARHGARQPSRRLDTSTPDVVGVVCTEELLEGFLHEEPVPGMHVVCLQQNRTANVYTRSWIGHVQTISFPSGYWDELKDGLDEALSLSTRPIKNQAWALFSPFGHRLADEETPVEDPKVMKTLMKEGLLLLISGGQWVWPGVRKGFRRTVDLSYLPGSARSLEPRNATLETISLFPLVLSVEGFLSDEECDFIQEQAAPMMRYSEVTLMDKDKGRPASDFRTSQTTFLTSSSETLKTVDKRTASLVRMPVRNQEHVQVLRYGRTEKYNSHHDYFDPGLYQQDPTTLRSIEYGKRNRMATVFWYLSTVPKGGETIFPRFDKAPVPYDMANCAKGLKVKPERGKVIIFYSMTPDGGLDPLSLHGACPVEEGIKWAANKWVWNAPMLR